MQFHLDGFRAGDPHFLAESPACHDVDRNQVDVLIVGCGPAGLTLAAQLCAFETLNVRIVERKAGPLDMGQADGIACRTMEMFEAFNFSERVLKESCWINETTFWKPDETAPLNIVRGGRIQDTEDGLSEFPHVVLNQARVHDMYLDVMRQSARRLEPDYSCSFVDLVVHERGAYPVEVTLKHEDAAGNTRTEVVSARYVVGCDGARSQVRRAIGRTLEGDSANQAWGVMDVLAVTDFPDIRFKSVIRSSRGNGLIIPREGGYLARFYIELDKLEANERVANKNITAEHLIQVANQILHPYTLDVKQMVWWSVYEIGQRLCVKFDDVPDELVGSREPRVFIAGDACHTHSPKAGQGMNVSMRDAFNLGWKLAAVLRGLSPTSLLHTYSAERQAVANELIEFDRHWAKRFSEQTKTAAAQSGDAMHSSEFQDYFAKHARFTAGTATCYQQSILTAETPHQHLASGWPVGMRFHSVPVVRVCDAMPVELAHTVKADGRWRLFIFAGENDEGLSGGSVANLCEFLTESPHSPIGQHTPTDWDIDSVFDVRAVFQQHHQTLNTVDMPSLLRPAKGALGLVDLEKVFTSDHKKGYDLFDMRGIDRNTGCVVVVRPDQYVAHIVPIADYQALTDFFAGVFKRQ